MGHKDSGTIVEALQYQDNPEVFKKIIKIVNIIQSLLSKFVPLLRVSNLKLRSCGFHLKCYLPEGTLGVYSG